MDKVKKTAMLISAIILVIVSTVIFVCASDIISTKPVDDISEAIKAADVCAEHLEQNCSICGINGSYHIECPYCGTPTIRCCNEECKEDDYEAQCLIKSHGSSCRTVQDLYWNLYFCTKCGWHTRGYHDDDFHVESYWHLNDPENCNNALCSLPRLTDLQASVAAKLGLDNPTPVPSSSGSKNSSNDKPYDPVAAGDFCEVHGIFACDIPHNNVRTDK